MTASTRTYDAYGHHRHLDGQARTAHAGQSIEAGADLYLLGNRPYDATLRRFLAADPVSPFDDGGLNRYAYCGGDPIGRIDPDGHTWLAWIVSTLDRMEFPLTPIRNTSGGDSAFASPTLTAVAATRAESAALRNAGQGSTDLMDLLKAYGDARVPISGPDTHATELFSAGNDIMGVLWPRRGDTGSATLFTTDRRTIQVIQGPHTFANDMQRAGRASRGKLYPQWLEKTNAMGGVHFATTTPINLAYLRQLKNYIGHQYPGKPVNLLAGAHGTPYGNNWGADGKRLLTEQRFHDSAASKASELHWPVTMLNYSDVSSAQMGSLLANGKDVFIHMTCFGAADELFMNSFQIRDITLRLLTALPSTGP